MKVQKRIALIAHDNFKPALVEWARDHIDWLKNQKLFATGTTGSRLESELGLTVHCFRSGPLGGDLQIGAKIVEGEVDFLVFFWDPLSPHSHDVDVKALLRITVVCNVPVACNRASADLIISSLF